MIKNLSCAKINNVNSLHFINININRYIEERNRNKYLILVPTGESQDTLKKALKKFEIKLEIILDK